MDHINNGPYQLIKEDPTINIKTKTLKPLKGSEGQRVHDSKLYYYLIPADLPEPYTSQEFLYVLLFHIVAPGWYNLNKYIADIFIAYIKDQNNNAKNSTTFSNYI